ncbi:sushi, von Willebrand factor type A, EGF and pentraxin domain-containing protein 1-like [Halichondria panicea]|uniref:sushi, von Willebrand factor type A, EGF and pentraxin domain-containing protein 1-like n=1 Tax=Halichondria panicea TaxID=6063 RepID=UPI00312BC84C
MYFVEYVFTMSGPCSDIPPLMNGDITYNGGLVDSRPVDTIATYTCDNGYTATGGIFRFCQNDGTWSATAPTCQLNTGPTEPPTTCPGLTVPNGMISYNMATTSPIPVDTVATYTCDTGYTLNGVSTRTCRSNGTWSGSASICQINCRDLPLVTNGMIMYSAESTNNRPFLSRALHSCNPGYTLTGGTFSVGTTRFCVSGGMWDGSDPTCQRPCFDLPPLMNGGITYTDGLADSRPVSTIATHICDNGYTLTTGGSFRTCQNEGTWDGTTPTCQLNTGPTEPPTTCPGLTVPANGMISYNMGTVSLRPVGTVATYTCDTGYTLNGVSTRTCGSDGVWSGSALICQTDTVNERPTEPPTTCPDLTVPANGVIIYSSGTSPHPQGTVATQSCLNGYVPSTTSTATRVCGAERLWSGSALTCQLTEVITTSSPTAIPGDTGASNTGGVVAGVVIVLLILAAVIVVGIIVGVYFWRKLRGNQTKYSPSPRHAPPPRPTPYQASFKKSNGQDSKVSIQKVDEPSIVEFPSDTHVTEGEEVYLRVKVGGHPPPSLTWYHDGRKVTADYATELDQDGGLSFPSVETKHAGVYKLVVTGASGSTTQQVVTVTVMSEGGEASEGVDYAPIPVTEFGAYVADLHVGSNKKFKDLYKNLDSGERGHPVIISVTPENKLNNRFGNIAVCECIS